MWVRLAPWVGRDMAVFLINICKFNGCGITFQSLGDLIQHIEDTHIGTYSHELPPLAVNCDKLRYVNVSYVYISIGLPHVRTV